MTARSDTNECERYHQNERIKFISLRGNVMFCLSYGYIRRLSSSFITGVSLNIN